MNEDRAMPSRLYEPGDWYAVIGPRVVVILPPEEKARVAALWALVDEGAGFEETLDALIADGLRALTGFVLVSTLAGETKVVVRGAARAAFVAGGQDVDLDGSGAATWVERTLHEVQRMVVDVSGTDAPGGAATSYSIDQGLVRISRLVEGEPPAPAPEAVAAEPVPVVAERAFEDSFDTAEPSPVDADPDGDPFAPTPVEPAQPDAFSSGAPEVQEPEDDLDGGLDDDLADLAGHPDDAEVGLGAAAPGPSFPPPPPPPPPPPAPSGSSVLAPPDPPADAPPADPVEDDYPTETFASPEHDGRTQFAPPDEDLSPPPPGIPGQPPAPPITSRPVARLLVSTGETYDVDRVIIFGRSPMAPRSPGPAVPVLVTVPSTHQEISSTHLEIRPGSGADHGTAVVTDLGSTNGTTVIQPGLDPDELQPGVSVQLIPGAIIDLGDGVTIQVSRP